MKIYIYIYEISNYLIEETNQNELMSKIRKRRLCCFEL